LIGGAAANEDDDDEEEGIVDNNNDDGFVERFVPVTVLPTTSFPSHGWSGCLLDMTRDSRGRRGGGGPHFSVP
jgi:hypothetical protein